MKNEARSLVLKEDIITTQLPSFEAEVERGEDPPTDTYIKALAAGSPVAVKIVPEIVFALVIELRTGPVVTCQGTPLLS